MHLMSSRSSNNYNTNIVIEPSHLHPLMKPIDRTRIIKLVQITDEKEHPEECSLKISHS
uniref:Uncharacterized protein n=1 Tax=Anopheles dirus TaxID=7168 RepID=A0A182NXI4_9DIPT